METKLHKAYPKWRPRACNFSPFLLSSNDNPINIVSSTKYLGVFIDNKLNFKEHILTLENKIARSVGILSKVRYNFPLKTLLQLYHALIHPLLTYGIVVWGSTYPSYLSKLKTLQNKAMQIISGSHYRDEANPIYKKLEVLQTHDLYTYETTKFVHSCFYNLAPIPFIDFFTKVDEVCQRATKQSVDKFSLYTPRYPTNRLRRGIKYQGVKIWNSIPKDIKSLKFQQFKSRFKTFLLSKYDQ